MIDRQAIIAEANSWLGTPYHHHARVKGAGVDCVHLLCAVVEAVDPSLTFDPGNYPREWHLHRSEETYLKNLDARMARTTTPVPGDIALFKFGRCYSHGAIFVGSDSLVHAYLGRGVILTRLTEDPLVDRKSIFWDLTTIRRV